MKNIDKIKKGKALLVALKEKRKEKQSILAQYTPPNYDKHYNQLNDITLNNSIETGETK